MRRAYAWLGLLAVGPLVFNFGSAEIESPAWSTTRGVHLLPDNSLAEKDDGTIVIEEPPGNPDETDLKEPTQAQIRGEDRKSRPTLSGIVPHVWL